MRVLVTGGRSFEGPEAWTLVRNSLDAIHALSPISSVLEGGARGADMLGRSWADLRGVRSITVMARWTDGKRAGMERNRRMLQEFSPDLVLAFPGGRGTADMVRRATVARVEVILIGEDRDAGPTPPTSVDLLYF